MPKYVLALDPGFTTGVALYNLDTKTLEMSCDADRKFVCDLLEDADPTGLLVAVEQPVRIVCRPVREVLFKMAWTIEYICERRQLKLMWITPGAHKRVFGKTPKPALCKSPHQFDAYTLALFAARFHKS